MTFHLSFRGGPDGLQLSTVRSLVFQWASHPSECFAVVLFARFSPRSPSPYATNLPNSRQHLPPPHLALSTERVPQIDAEDVLHPLPPKDHLSLCQLWELKHDAPLHGHQLPNHRARILRLRVHRRLMNRVPGLQQGFAMSVICPVRWLSGAVAVGVGSCCGEF
jgi:hypothetical protein